MSEGPSIESIREAFRWVGGSPDPSDPSNSAVIIRGDERHHSGAGWYTFGEYPDEGSFYLGNDDEKVRQAARAEGVELPAALLDASSDPGSATSRRVSSLDGYQRLTRRTVGDASLSILALGIAGEAGEVADSVKKHLGHGHPLDQEHLAEELGDLLWYVAALADALGVTLAKVANTNVEKLRRRYPDGFSTERSLNRPLHPKGES